MHIVYVAVTGTSAVQNALKHLFQCTMITNPWRTSFWQFYNHLFIMYVSFKLLYKK